MMAEKKVSFVPTIYALKSILPFSEAGDSKHSMEIIAGHIKTVRLASDLGVELKVGSDSGAKGLEHGEGFFREVEAFSAAGLSIEAVLRAACLNGIKAGGKANFLAVTKGPIKKESLRLIVIEGKIPELNCL
jgi:hypothetical protein